MGYYLRTRLCSSPFVYVCAYGLADLSMFPMNLKCAYEIKVNFFIAQTVLFRLNYTYVSDMSVIVRIKSPHNSFTDCHLCVICISPVRNADLVLLSSICVWPGPW